MIRKAAMKQLFNFVQDEYNIKSSDHIQVLYQICLGVLSRKALEAELNQHLGYSEYDLKQIYQAIN